MINAGIAGSYSPLGFSLLWEHQKGIAEHVAGISFDSKGTESCCEWTVISKGQAESQLQDYLLRKAVQPKLCACFLIGLKASKAKSVNPMLRKMKLISEGRAGQTLQVQGQEITVPYSFVVLHDPASYKICFAKPVDNTGLLMSFYVHCGQKKGIAMMDSGATHSFVQENFLVSLGVPIRGQSQGIQLADGSAMQSQGTAKFRINVARNCSEYRNFIVCNELIQGVDIILGQDFLSKYRVVLDYGAQTCVLRHPKCGRTSILHHSCDSRPPAFPPVEVSSRNRKGRRVLQSVLRLLSVAVQGNLHGTQNVNAWRNVQVDGMPMDDQDLEAYLEHGAHSLNPTDFRAGLAELSLPPSMSDLLVANQDLFPSKLPGLPPHRGVTHAVPLEAGHKPLSRPVYRLAPKELEECRTQVEDLLSQGLIRPSSSPFASPVLFVPKKEGTLRMVIDYRPVNKITIQDKYPIPRIDELLDSLQGAQYFSSLDLLSGYHQVRLNESDIPKTAFRTPMGLYEFLVLPFGLTNAPATFQRLMNTIFHDFIREGFVVVYLDDLLVFSKTEEEHIVHLQRVFDRLREHKLYAKLTKCSFFKEELQYLGHIVGRGGLKVDPKKISVVHDWPVPVNVHDVRRFLGLANYFRKFIQGYSRLASPLTELTGSNTPWTWTGQQQAAFEGIKHALTRAPVLALPDPSKPYKVICDASDFGVGGVLTQDGRAIAFFSRKLNAAERNYHTTEKELAAVMYALKEWRCYLLGNQFTVVTDHKANSFLQEQSFLSPRRARWAEFLQIFDIVWLWEPGRTNVADPLSRSPALLVVTRGSLQSGAGPRGKSPSVGSHGVGARAMDCDGAADPIQLTPSLTGCEHWLPKLKEAYSDDPWLKRKQNRRKLVYEGGLWLKDTRIYVPMHHIDSDGVEGNLRRDIIDALHGPPHVGHPGRTKTVELVTRSWWWPGLYEDVKDFVAFCDSCQKVKPSTQVPAGLLQPLEIPKRKWQSISMDLITGLPRTRAGFDAIWVVVDRLSKCAHFATTTTNADAQDIAELLRTRVYMNHGAPIEIVSDRDPRFTAKFSQALFKLTGCRSALSTAFHPQTDGQTERVNRILEDYLRHYVGPRQTDWDTHLPEAEFAYNNSWQASINTTPFRLTYGQDPIIPFQKIVDTNIPSADAFARQMKEDLDRARRFLVAAQDRQRFYADARRRDLTLDIGQSVLLSTRNIQLHGTRKLLPRFIGPFTVTQKVSPVAYRLALPEGYRIHNVFHVSLLRPYLDNGTVQPPPPELVDGEEEYEVEAILLHRDKQGRASKKREYLVRWKGFGPVHDSWEPEGAFERAREALQEYWDSRGVVKAKTNPRKRKRA